MLGLAKNKIQGDIEVFNILDSQTNSYDIPTYAVNKHDLCRQVVNMFRDPGQKQNRFLLNAEDFIIFKIGTYSKQTGEITPCVHERVAYMHELKKAALDQGIVST